jgi:hypothetical protein
MASDNAHAADQAGGEIVFSSDGLDPLPVPPPKVSNAVASETEDAELVSESFLAEGAFEVFAGKLYPSSSTTILRSSETPLQRLGRLQFELNAVAAELTSQVSTVDEQAMLEKLKLQLQETTTHLWPRREEQLTKDITTSVQGLELQPNAMLPADATLQSSSLLEDRLLRLEAAVGSGFSLSIGSSSSSTSLMERLVKLENAAAKLDPTQAEQWQRRAKTIRHDLEAAAKARGKLNSAGSSSSDAKTVTELYNTSQQLQGLQQHLAPLVARLQAVAHLHTDAATWSQRLQETERAATTLQCQLTMVETAVSNLQTTIQENAAVMQENIKALDERRAARTASKP